MIGHPRQAFTGWPLKLVFYSKIAPWLENLQQQAIFDGAFFQTSKCSDKF
jgi:hypothetical protein